MMRRMEQFFYVFMLTITMAGVMLLADLMILAYLSAQTEGALSDLSPAYIAEEIHKTVQESGEVQYSMSQQGMNRVDGFHGFVFLLDDAGEIIWSYRLPEDVPRHYTIKEIVQFTRFYLKDYPVYVRIVDDGILVIGMPRNTVWKYQLSFQVDTMNMFSTTLPVLFIVNIIVLLVVPFFIIRRDTRKREMQRTSWIAGVSHDVRTPLSLIIGYADELMRAPLDCAGTKERAQLIEKQAIRIKTLVTNLNTSNKLTYGMGAWHREQVLLPALIRETICDIVNRNLDEKYDIDVTISDSLEQLYVKGDKELMKRLVENLMNNAINSNMSGCEIRVSLMCQNGRFFKKTVLEISDNGCGVSIEQLKKFRTSMRSEKLPEHGLGIRLVRQIASFHHWKVRFFNNADGGFTCRIYL